MQAKIDKVKMLQFMNEGKTNKEMAAFFGCNIYTMQKATKKFRNDSKRVPVVQESELSSENIDAMKQLVEINNTMQTALHRCITLIIREEEKAQEFETTEKLLAGVKDQPEKTPQDEEAIVYLENKLKSLSDRTGKILQIQNNMINISGEARKQIELQIKIAETLYNIQMSQEFQSEIIQAIREIDQFTAKKIVTRLKEKRALRGLTRVAV